MVALGANLGDVRGAFIAANRALKMLALSEVKMASVYRSAPWQAQGPDYFNTVCVFTTHWSAPALLQALQGIEQDAGRERKYLNAPRTLDLDLIFYGDSIMSGPDLSIPHPRWFLRGFVVEPLFELLPGKVNPAVRLEAHDPSLIRLASWADWVVGLDGFTQPI